MTESIPTDVLLPGIPRWLLIGLAFLALAALLGKVIRKLGQVAWSAVRLVRAWKHKFVYDDDAIQSVSSRRAVARHYIREAAWHLWGSDRYAGQRYRCEHPSGCDEFTLDLTRNSSNDATRRKRVCLKHRCAQSPNCGQMAVGTIEPHTHYQLPRLVCWDHLDHGNELEIEYFKPFAAFEEDWKYLDPDTKRPVPLAVRLNNPGLLLAPPEKPLPLDGNGSPRSQPGENEE
ncbi:MAG: hypothetical protein F4091_01930 [Acidimicrobiales bacterium]|nr:hypothetical protein [Acidimicrobiales bacterium]MYD82183.1 hypothetical protein [Acidimicrobiales bacterium]MYJ64212.1 hypothetical protein [Acidimicrobiales bacterium]